MDILDKQYKVKKFFKLIYRDIDITENEYIRVFQNNNLDYKKVSYYNNIDELVSYVTSKYTKFNNTYFTLATTDGEGGATENLKYRYCIAFDFDKKDYEEGFNYIDILNRFRDAKIHYHALVDSGNGYHVYVCIHKTSDLQKVEEVQKALCYKLGADKNAIKQTQILRVPYTFNIKNGHKQVNIIYIEDRHSKLFKPYDINFLYDKNCNVKHEEVKKEQTSITINNTNIPECIKNILKNGSKEGDRYTDLQKIIVLLRQRNKSLEEIKKICEEWAKKSDFADNLAYRVDNIYNNLSYIKLECKECKYKKECYSVVLSDFEYSKNDKLIRFSDIELSKLNNKKKRGKSMKSNDLLVYSILKLHNDGLTKEEITKELTYKSKRKKIVSVVLGDKTLRDALKNLQENGYIEVSTLAKNKKLYKIINSTSSADMQLIISFSATMECIKQSISTEEYMLYCYMRYLHHKEQQKGTKLKGNLFQVNQTELAEHFGVSQGRISQMINNLLDEKLLSIWYRQTSQNNGYKYNIYRLNY